MILAWLAALALASTALTERQVQSKRKRSSGLFNLPDYLKKEATRAWELFHEFATPTQLVQLDRRLEEGTADELLPPGWALSYDYLFYAYVTEEWARPVPAGPQGTTFEFFQPSEGEPHVVWTGLDQVLLQGMLKRAMGKISTGFVLQRRSAYGIIPIFPPGNVSNYRINPFRGNYTIINPRTKNKINAVAVPFGSPGELRIIPYFEDEDPRGLHFAHVDDSPTAHQLLLSLPLNHPFVQTWLINSIRSEIMAWRSPGVPIEYEFNERNWFPELNLSPDERQSLSDYANSIIQASGTAHDLSIIGRRVARVPGSSMAYDRLFGHLPNRGRTSRTAEGRIVFSDHRDALPVPEATRATIEERPRPPLLLENLR